MTKRRRKEGRKENQSTFREVRRRRRPSPSPLLSAKNYRRKEGREEGAMGEWARERPFGLREKRERESGEERERPSL